MSDFQDKLREAKQIQRKIDLQHRQLKNLVQYLRVSASEKPSFIPCGGCMRNYIPVDQAFHRAFKYFTKEQKIVYYHRIVSILSKCLDRTNVMSSQAYESPKKQSFYFFNDDHGSWQTRLVEVDYEKKRFVFASEKHQINLRYYILRNSKKTDRKCLALESIEDLQTPTTIRISNHKDPFEQLRDLLDRLIFQATQQKFMQILFKSSKESKRKSQVDNFKLSRTPSTKQLHLEHTKSIIIPETQPKILKQVKIKPAQNPVIKVQQQLALNRRQMTPIQFQKMKIKLITSLNNKENLSPNEKGVLINVKQNRVRKIHEIKEQDFNFSLEWFKDILMSSASFKRWKPTLKSVHTLWNQQDGKVFYQQHQYQQRCVTSYIYKRQVYEVQSEAIYFFDYTVEDKTKKFSSNNKIEYVVWKFQKLNKFINVVVQAKIVHDAKLKNISTNLTTQFLGQLYKLYENSNITFIGDNNFNVNTFLFERQYLSQMHEMGLDDSQDFFSILENQSILNQSAIKIVDDQIQKVVSENIEDAKLPEKSFLKHLEKEIPKNRYTFKHPVEPYPKSHVPKLKLPKTKGVCPYWQNQFKFNDAGDMISTNQKKIKAQSGVLGQIIANIGRNLFSGKGILNMSLPVTIFSHESNLSLLCKSLAYAPVFLQKAAKCKDPIQRMKHVVAFATGCTTAYIQMDKPFNPILGETYHCLIDGCPVYGEQISHHPPISAMFMKGRGYTLYGNFEAKVSIGLNSATGSNDGICNISFDEKNIENQVVKYNYQPGEISGLTVGQRIIHAVDKSCYLDVQNYLYLQLRFGKHKGITEFCKYHNGIQGQLVELDHNTDLFDFPKINTKKIIKRHGRFFGRWTEEIYYEEQTIFNSWKQYPYQCQNYPFPLQSDAFYRKDLLLKIQGKVDQAQTAKEQLQNIQRNDRKLRKKYTGKEH